MHDDRVTYDVVDGHLHLRCLGCERVEVHDLPISVWSAARRVDVFARRHQLCGVALIPPPPPAVPQAS